MFGLSGFASVGQGHKVLAIFLPLLPSPGVGVRAFPVSQHGRTKAGGQGLMSSPVGLEMTSVVSCWSLAIGP